MEKKFGELNMNTWARLACVASKAYRVIIPSEQIQCILLVSNNEMPLINLERDRYI